MIFKFIFLALIWHDSPFNHVSMKWDFTIHLLWYINWSTDIVVCCTPLYYVEGGCEKKTFLAMAIMEERTKKVMEEMCVSVRNHNKCISD